MKEKKEKKIIDGSNEDLELCLKMLHDDLIEGGMSMKFHPLDFDLIIQSLRILQTRMLEQALEIHKLKLEIKHRYHRSGT